MRRYYAKKELSDNDQNSQMTLGYKNIPEGVEVTFENVVHNFYGVFAKVTYEGVLYYVHPYDLECRED